MTIKHSKFKNTGLLFELLVRQIAADTLENKDSKAAGILRKYFSKTELGKEYNIYKTLSSNNPISESKATILIDSSLQAQKKLNQTSIRQEKYALISEIKQNYSLDEFFKAKIDNYKILASVYLLFEINNSKEFTTPTSITNYKVSILENLTRVNIPTKQDPVLEEFNNSDKQTRLLVYKMMVGKFNQKYKDVLNERQKGLLKEYIKEVSMTPRLREYVNEQLVIVKDDLKKLLPKIQDKPTQIKVKQVTEIIKEVPKTKSVTDEDVSNLFNYYELIDEINEIIK